MIVEYTVSHCVSLLSTETQIPNSLIGFTIKRVHLEIMVDLCFKFEVVIMNILRDALRTKLFLLSHFVSYVFQRNHREENPYISFNSHKAYPAITIDICSKFGEAEMYISGNMFGTK